MTDTKIRNMYRDKMYKDTETLIVTDSHRWRRDRRQIKERHRDTGKRQGPDTEFTNWHNNKDCS